MTDEAYRRPPARTATRRAGPAASAVTKRPPSVGLERVLVSVLHGLQVHYRAPPASPAPVSRMDCMTARQHDFASQTEVS